MKKIIVACILLILILGCTSQNNTTLEKNKKLQIVASFYPIYDITRNVAGDSANVSVLVPPGMEPHEFELSPQDTVRINKADMFIATGAEFGEWEEDAVESLNPQITIVDASKNIFLLPLEEHHEEPAEHDHGAYDPHYWVAPKNAVIIAQTVRDALVAEDPVHADEYRTNAENYIRKLNNLDSAYSDGLANCKEPIILTTHASFAYLSNEYGFDQIPLLGLTPEAEPRPQAIVMLIKEAQEHGVKYIFYDELVDPRVSETIAREAHAQTLVINSGESVKNPEQDTYISVMERNLENLKIAMECR